jgi:ABC-type molybdate transport system ATPase subunit
VQVLDRNVENLSGGELQRFAIAVVAAQTADVYMIDEPSSYLDVRQRLKAAKVSSEHHVVPLQQVQHGMVLGDVTKMSHRSPLLLEAPCRKRGGGGLPPGLLRASPGTPLWKLI